MLNSFKSILQIEKTATKVSGVTFADVTTQGKTKSTNCKSWIPISTVSNVSAQVPSLEDFPLLADVRKKMNVPKDVIRNQDLPGKIGTVLVSGRVPVPIVPKKDDPHATRGQSKVAEGPSKPKK